MGGLKRLWICLALTYLSGCASTPPVPHDTADNDRDLNNFFVENKKQEAQSHVDLYYKCTLARAGKYYSMSEDVQSLTIATVESCSNHLSDIRASLMEMFGAIGSDTLKNKIRAENMTNQAVRNSKEKAMGLATQAIIEFRRQKTQEKN